MSDSIYEINIPNREYNWGPPIKCNLTVEAGKKSVSLKDCDTRLSDGFDYGMVVRMQSRNAVAPAPDTIIRVSSEGNPLLNLNSFGGAFITMYDKKTGISSDKMALELMGFNKDFDKPGVYMQVIILDGIVLSKSQIELFGVAPTQDEDIELYFIPIGKECRPFTICPT